MSIPQKSLFCLLSLCQKFLQSVKIWLSSDKKISLPIFLRHGVEFKAPFTLSRNEAEPAGMNNFQNSSHIRAEMS